MSDEANEEEAARLPMTWRDRVRWVNWKRKNAGLRVRIMFWTRCRYPYAAWLVTRSLVWLIVGIGVFNGVCGWVFSDGVHQVQNVLIGAFGIMCALIAAARMHWRFAGHRITVIRGTGKAAGMAQITCEVQSLTMNEPVAYASCARCGVVDVTHLPTPVEAASSPEPE